MLHTISPANRRSFLRMAATIAIGSICRRSVLAAAKVEPTGGAPAKQGLPIQIGILLGTFSHGTFKSRLDAAKASGLDCVQVSLDCAGVPAMPDSIPADLSARIRREATACGITVASVQGTFNMSHPDPDQRRAGLRRLRVLANACSEIGTSKVHLCTGTRDRDNMWRYHPDNDSPAAWHDMTECVREATAIAHDTGVVLAFEPEVNNVVNSAGKARRLLDEIGSPHLKITMDAANLFPAGELPHMKEILDEAFSLLGKDVVLAHAKDLDHDGDAGHLAAGTGKLDYDRYVALLHANGFKGPLLLHGLTEAQVPTCVAFLRQKIAALR
jgi:sugar phosphate isomerase/epimerase